MKKTRTRKTFRGWHDYRPYRVGIASLEVFFDRDDWRFTLEARSSHGFPTREAAQVAAEEAMRTLALSILKKLGEKP